MNGNSRFSPYIEFIVYNEELGICSKVQVEGRELSDLKKTIKAADKRADKRNEAI